MLPASAGATYGRPFDVAVPENDFDGGWLWQYRHRDCARVDSPALLVWWNTLPAMTASLVCEDGYRGWAGKLADQNTGAVFNDVDVKGPSAAQVCGTRIVVR